MSNARPITVGLAGGVAAGKSAVARLFEELGAVTVDADRIGHEVLREDAIRERLVERWGGQALGPDGDPDRCRIASIVFGDPEAREFLNSLVHPRIRERMRRQIEAHRQAGTAEMIVLDAALLLEAGLEGWCDAMVFVDAPEQVREERARAGRGWTDEELRRRESGQMTPAAKRSRCEHVIVNDGTLEKTRSQVKGLYERLVSVGFRRSNQGS